MKKNGRTGFYALRENFFGFTNFLGCRENLNLFARKFSETIDKGLIDEILVRLKNERN